MSGLCGVIHWDEKPVAASTLRAMACAAAHRGPDGIHYWQDGHAGLVHLALHITPESTRERQPLVSTQGDLVLTADARIDNRDELTNHLKGKGHLRHDQPTDADIILAAYRCWNEDCAEHLIGDFAFAIWDERRQQLYAARDPMAMRAFYYRTEPHRILFATEVKQILAAPGVPKELYEPMVAAYLNGRFTPLERTFYQGISQLAPAHALTVNQAGHRTWRYWDIDPKETIKYGSEQDYVAHFLEIFKEAVRCRLRSVKPVGIMLSGGMDSGSIAATAGWLLQRGEVTLPEFRAYSWAFNELTQADERHISSKITDHYQLPVTQIEADHLWPLKNYPDHGPDQDEPYIGVYQALLENTFAKAQSEGMRLLLSGDRGDLMLGDMVFDHLGPLLAGKLRLLRNELRAHSAWRNTPLPTLVHKQVLRPLLSRLWPPGHAEGLRGRLGQNKGRSPAKALEAPWLERDFLQRQPLNGSPRTAIPPSSLKDPARRARYGLVFTGMHMRGVIWSERSQARFGMGFADPYSDRRIARFVLAAPQWMIQCPSHHKRIVRQAMRGIMPADTAQLATKVSPRPLYHRALHDRARPTVLDLLSVPQAERRGFLAASRLRDHYDCILAGERDHPFFWWALSLEMWLRRYWRV